MNRDDTYQGTIARVLFSEGQIEQIIGELAARIAGDYAGKPLLLVGVLKGALYVTADLARALALRDDGPSEIHVDYIVVSSYGNRSRSSGEVRMLKDTSENLSERNVLLVEDIVDEGLTLSYLQGLMRERHPQSLRSCALFDKPFHRRVDVNVDYIGTPVPDTFVVGYGLDYQERYRNLPYLAQLENWVFGSDAG